MSGIVELSADARCKTIGQNFRCRAWVSFVGTSGSGTGHSDITINASANVSSVTDNGAGNYAFTMTKAMPDNKYCAVGAGGIGGSFTAVKTTPDSTTVVGIDTSNDLGGWVDAGYVGCAVFR